MSYDMNVTNPKHYKLFGDIESIELIARSMTVERFLGFVSVVR